MSSTEATKKRSVPRVSRTDTGVADGLHRRNGEAAPESTGVPGVVSARRLRRDDARRRQLKDTEDAANDRGPWLNAEQTAVYLALPSAKAVYQAVRRGEIPVYRFGKRLRFKSDDLDDLLIKGRVLTPSDEGLSSLPRRPLAGEGR